MYTCICISSVLPRIFRVVVGFYIAVYPLNSVSIAYIQHVQCMYYLRGG